MDAVRAASSLATREPPYMLFEEPSRFVPTDEASHLYRCGALLYNKYNMKVSSEETVKMSLHGIDVAVYPLQRDDIDLVRVSTKEGHFQEFIHKTSTFVYYVLGGSGTFYLDGQAIPVKQSDVVVAPPGTKIYYLGSLEMILVTTPAWKEEDEIEVRKIERPSE